ncbi:hypothetical protein TNCV_2017491 [Trichonephila clavipes]|nr:hypothetical protein TNCV_2017491 [Trichonephila clavipes]
MGKYLKNHLLYLHHGEEVVQNRKEIEDTVVSEVLHIWEREEKAERTECSFDPSYTQKVQYGNGNSTKIKLYATAPSEQESDVIPKSPQTYSNVSWAFRKDPREINQQPIDRSRFTLAPCLRYSCCSTRETEIGVLFSSTNLYVDSIEQISISHPGPWYYLIWSRHGYDIILITSLDVKRKEKNVG